MPRKGWRREEENLLIENYNMMTIVELRKLLKGRSPDSINAKIKRLKAEGRITGQKTDDTVTRSLIQRRRD